MHQLPPVPADTLRVGRAAFPKGTMCMQIRDVLEVVCTDARFEPLFTWRGRHSEAPWRLLSVMLLQFAEGLSDRQAAEAVRSRVDWKYLLGLDLADSGFNAALLAHFRAHLTPSSAEQHFLDALLTACVVSNLPNRSSRHRLDAQHLRSDAILVNRLHQTVETFREALRAITVAAPEWIDIVAPLDWHVRYGPLARAAVTPRARGARQRFVETLRADGQCLLDALKGPDAPAGLADLEVVQLLGRVWARDFSVRNGRTELTREMKSADHRDDPHGFAGTSLRSRAGRLRWDLRRWTGATSAQASTAYSSALLRRGTR
jgi:transposase